MQLDVCIASPGLAHSGDTLGQRSLGGSETAAIHIARALAARGHHVTVGSPGGSGVHERVTYIDFQQFPAYAGTTPHDVTIISRATDLYRFRMASKVQVLWCHDLGLKRNAGTLGGVLWALDAIYVLSEFHKRQLREVNPGVPESSLFVTRNGIDARAFEGLRNLPRDPHKLVYGSRPERGLENALAVMDVLARQGSPLRLYVSWYDNTPPHLAQYYQALWARAQQMPNVTLLGPLKQADWHRELATAGALIYPACSGDFYEVSCLLLAEAQACGTPVVATARGAIPETLAPGAGTLLGNDDTNPDTAEFRAEFAAAVTALTSDEDAWQAAHRTGLARGALLDWGGVAAQWEQHWLGILERRSSDPARVRAHFARIGEREVTA